MANDDWAIVVGIEIYPGIDTPEDHLEGPDNDARAFRDWLIDPAGGNVPNSHVMLITTSDFNPPFGSIDIAKPSEDLIRKSAESLQGKASDTGHVGQRLYLYMAGHGFAPREDQTALLMANATKINVGPPYHWLGDYTANWFFRAGYFDEVMLFMDSCRDDFQVPGLNMPWLTVSDPDKRVKRFYAFGTRWSMKSREEKMPDGITRGIFTYALLEGLRGGAYQPAPDDQNTQFRVITTSSLRRYLLDKMKEKRQEIMPSDFVADDFDVVTLPPIMQPEEYTYPVTFHLPPDLAGKKAEILDNSFRLVTKIEAATAVWQLALEKGLYAIRVPADNIQKLFLVSGTGGVDVRV